MVVSLPSLALFPSNASAISGERLDIQTITKVKSCQQKNILIKESPKGKSTENIINLGFSGPKFHNSDEMRKGYLFM